MRTEKKNISKDISIDEVAAILRRANCVAIYSHINTDCDAMGSALALAEVLGTMGKRADVFIDSNFPNNFSFFGDLSAINKKRNKSYDLAVCVDAATESRLGKNKFVYRRGGVEVLNIDHHFLSSDRFGDYNYIKDTAATAEILFDIFEKLNVKLNEFACKCLYAGILTDTGRFAHGANTHTFQVCSKLVELGNLKIDEINNKLFNSMTLGTYKMLKRAYQKTELYFNNEFALLMFSVTDFNETGTTMDDLDAFADLALVLGTVKLAVLASESDRGFFRVSVRSKGNFSARAMAEVFGGSGHFNASGCKIFGSFEEVKQRLVDAAQFVLGGDNG